MTIAIRTPVLRPASISVPRPKYYPKHTQISYP